MLAGSMNGAPLSWPEAWASLESELKARRGGFAAVDMSARGALRTLALLTNVVAEVFSVGARFAEYDEPPSIDSLFGRLHATTLFTDIEVLFSPMMKTHAVPLLRQVGRYCPLIVAWPGRIANGRFCYSVLGRSDYVDVSIDGALILRPVETQFPDEVPYVVERTPV
jgi:hypothetical protein